MNDPAYVIDCMRLGDRQGQLDCLETGLTTVDLLIEKLDAAHMV